MLKKSSVSVAEKQLKLLIVSEPLKLIHSGRI